MVRGVRDGCHLAFQPRRILEAVRLGGISWQDSSGSTSLTIAKEQLDLLGDDFDHAGAAFLRILSDIGAAQREQLEVGQEVVDPTRRQHIFARHSQVIGAPYFSPGADVGRAADAQYPVVMRVPLDGEEDAHLRIGLDVANGKRPIRRAEPDAAALVDKIERVDDGPIR